MPISEPLAYLESAHGSLWSLVPSLYELESSYFSNYTITIFGYNIDFFGYESKNLYYLVFILVIKGVLKFSSQLRIMCLLAVEFSFLKFKHMFMLRIIKLILLSGRNFVTNSFVRAEWTLKLLFLWDVGDFKVWLKDILGSTGLLCSSS